MNVAAPESGVSADRAGRVPYEPPAVTDLGSVSGATQASGGGIPGGG
jgi:hypothetical protein